MKTRSDIISLLSTLDLDSLLISSPHTLRYLSGYFGFSVQERDGYMLVTENDIYLLVNSLHFEGIKKKTQNFTLREITSSQPLSKHLQQIMQHNHISSMGIEDKDLRVEEFIRIQKVIKRLNPVSLDDIRILKTQDEIENIAKACSIADDSIKELIKKITVSMTEKEIVTMFENIVRSKNAEPSFPTIVAWNENAATPHHLSDQTQISSNGFLLIDCGVNFNNYCSDMTRTFALGKIDEEMNRAYDTVFLSHKKAVDFIEMRLKNSETISACEVDKVARDTIKENGFLPFPHSLGHGIGLEVHEAPSLSPHSDDILENGMVFSIEPGIYIPQKYGIRIEDLYTIENNSLRQLTTFNSSLTYL
ncbi:MAG: Xaa-Pro aminopeptidase [Patescibacteria group bacterium]|nr:Xaa-Pro aminopeptidase [Patescibacteria group bacterium]